MVRWWVMDDLWNISRAKVILREQYRDVKGTNLLTASLARHREWVVGLHYSVGNKARIQPAQPTAWRIMSSLERSSTVPIYIWYSGLDPVYRTGYKMVRREEEKGDTWGGNTQLVSDSYVNQVHYIKSSPIIRKYTCTYIELRRPSNLPQFIPSNDQFLSAVEEN